MTNKYFILTIVYISELAFIIGLYYFFKWYVNNPPKKEKILIRWKKNEKTYSWLLKNYWVIIVVWLLTMFQFTRIFLNWE